MRKILAIFVTVLITLLVLLISLHYYSTGNYSYYVPELLVFNCKNYDLISCIEIIDLVEAIIVLLLTICLFYIIPEKNILNPSKTLLVISNSLLGICILGYCLYWNVQEFMCYDDFKIFSFLIILISILYNTWCVAQMTKKAIFLPLIFLPPIMLLEFTEFKIKFK